MTDKPAEDALMEAEGDTILANPSRMSEGTQTYIDRAYTRRALMDCGGPQQDMWACFHPNGLCVLGLLATHPLFRKAAAIGEEHLQIKVQYSEVGKQPLAEVRCNAKKMKKGDGTWVAPDTHICDISVCRAAPAKAAAGCDQQAEAADVAAAQACEPARQPDSDGAGAEAFACVSGVHGKVLCMNTRLLSEPELLWRRPHDEGYLMIVAMHAARHKELQASMEGVDAVAERRGVGHERLRACAVFDDLQQHQALAPA